ncbi:MAG: hypothetical protein K2M19_01350 [Muribaculaceae bacterium]|nr:hypothetical protein [Muribaculaceae bacterium]
MTVSEIVGYAAAVCMICGYLPQAVATIKSRDTEGIALPTFLMLGLGSLLFVIQGVLGRIWSLALANTIPLICSVIIFAIKLRNDYGRRK